MVAARRNIEMNRLRWKWWRLLTSCFCCLAVVSVKMGRCELSTGSNVKQSPLQTIQTMTTTMRDNWDVDGDEWRLVKQWTSPNDEILVDIISRECHFYFFPFVSVFDDALRRYETLWFGVVGSRLVATHRTPHPTHPTHTSLPLAQCCWCAYPRLGNDSINLTKYTNRAGIALFYRYFRDLNDLLYLI